MECSFLPHLNVDQFQWTQHNRYWREDFQLARHELGIRHLRYALPWHAIEPQRGTFDWSNGRFPVVADPSPAYHGLAFHETFGMYGYLMKLRAESLRDFASCVVFEDETSFLRFL